MTNKTINYLCPCEEQEMIVKNPSAEIKFCPFCGHKSEESDIPEINLDEDNFEKLEDELILDGWDDQDRDRF
jgi:rRNA maturation endonuclease Nob1